MYINFIASKVISLFEQDRGLNPYRPKKLRNDFVRTTEYTFDLQQWAILQRREDEASGT
jgi:hypothetical protein